jgi:hypothetical protein
MTTEERLDRIEHLTAGIAEERRKDREEYKALWRDSQREMAEIRQNINEASAEIKALAVETRLRFDEVGDRIDKLAAESRAADQRLGERIDSLVSAIGEFIRHRKD